jgi:hypothetical protein
MGIAVCIIIVLVLLLTWQLGINDTANKTRLQLDKARKELEQKLEQKTKEYDAERAFVESLKESEKKLATDPDKIRLRLDEKTKEYENLAERVRLGALEQERRTLAEEKQAFKSSMGEIRRRIIAQANTDAAMIRGAAQGVADIAKRWIDAIKQRDKDVSIHWIANKFGEFIDTTNEEIAHLLEAKRNPAKKSAERLREEGARRRDAVMAARIAQMRIEAYERMFPFLRETVDDDAPLIETSFWDGEESWEEQDDESARWLSSKDYQSLSSAEKGQRALDNWLRYMKSGRPSSWEIGVEYEDFVGYTYEKEGWRVDYNGIAKRKEDMGRDLICEKDGQILIVQCKRWKQSKEIHENHINQLLGTTLEYALAHNCRLKKLGVGGNKDLLSLDFSMEVIPVFAVDGKLSDTAQRFADILGVEVREIEFDPSFPRIKCNISANGDRIYHLPFDQQYPYVKLVKQGEFRARTVKEAEEARPEPFRRAKRHAVPPKGNG